MTPETKEALIEKLGRAEYEVFHKLICAWNGNDPAVTPVCPLSANAWTRKAWLRVFDATHSIISEAGMVVVPREPTGAMRIAGSIEKNANRNPIVKSRFKSGVGEIYKAMVAAAEKGELG